MEKTSRRVWHVLAEALLELVVAVLAIYVLFGLLYPATVGEPPRVEHGFLEVLKDKIVESLLAWVLLTVVVHVLKQSLKIDLLADHVAALASVVDGDERIIVARSEPMSQRRSLSIVAVDPLEAGQVPAAVSKPQHAGNSGKWGFSVSILRFDRIQDLLFSRPYLEHFFALSDKATAKSRILIVNDTPRSSDAVKAFLEISRHLNITTYVYRKSEYYKMLDGIGKKLRKIAEGQPELNLAASDPGQFQALLGAGALTEENEFVLRYQTNGPQSQIQVKGPGDVEFDTVKALLFLMRAAFTSEREYVAGFERLFAQCPDPQNPWEPIGLKAAAGRQGVSL